MSRPGGAIPQQCTSKVLMVRPKRFTWNVEAALDNKFMHNDDGNQNVSLIALREFEALSNVHKLLIPHQRHQRHHSIIIHFITISLKYCQLLKESGVEVTVLEVKDDLDTPDCLFPNNWFSTHSLHECAGTCAHDW